MNNPLKIAIFGAVSIDSGRKIVIIVIIGPAKKRLWACRLAGSTPAQKMIIEPGNSR